MELVSSVGGGVGVLKKPGVGKNINSVFEDFFPVSMFISSPNRANFL